MMLRPATPLTFLFFVAFILLLLSTLSTPIIHSIPLSKYSGYNFGVFGYCEINAGGADTCKTKLGYLTPIVSGDNFTLPQDSRNKLSSILIVHPVAAALTLLCTVLAAASHLRGPSHSPRYLLALLILTFPTLLVTLLAFLVDILLFIPNLAWGGWIVLAATLIITACSVLTCAMRRTLVSRKARKRRIAENADMNGENFYAMKQAQSFARAESPPPAVIEPPKFAVFEQNNERSSIDDRTPLNNAQAPSIRTMSSTGGPTASQPNSTPGAPNTGLSGSTAVFSAGEINMTPKPYSRENSNRGTPSGTFGPSENERLRDPQSDRSRQNVYPPYRGGPPSRGVSSRGVPPTYPPGRGGYPPQRGNGPPPRGAFRGGYGPPGPQGYPSRGSFGPGPRGSPPGPWNGRGRGMPGRRGSPGANYTPGPYGRSPPTSPREYETGGLPPGRATQPIYDPNYVPNNAGMQRIPQTPYQNTNQGQEDDAAAVIDAYSTRSPEPPTNTSFARDPASFGFSGRQSPGRGTRTSPRLSSDIPPMPAHNISELDAGQAAELDSVPRTGIPGVVSELDANETFQHSSAPAGPGGIPLWREASPVELGESSPRRDNFSHNQIPDQESPPIELPAEAVLAITENQPPIQHTRSASSNYYEDVDPKFAADEPVIAPLRPVVNTSIAALQAEGSYRRNSNSYEDLPKDVDRTHGNRSPAVSETSNFTSISQRPINPSWRPPPPPPMEGVPYSPRGRGWGIGRGARGGRGGIKRKPYAESSLYSGPASQASARYRAQETVLNANPDFTIPSPMSRRMVGSPPRTARPSHDRVLSNGSHHYPDP